MSGGSYNYLYAEDIQDLIWKSETLQRMADRLSGLGYAEDAARETEELLLIIRQYITRAESRQQRLAPVWKAIEWWDSGDWGEDTVKEVLMTYRGND